MQPPRIWAAGTITPLSPRRVGNARSVAERRGARRGPRALVAGAAWVALVTAALSAIARLGGTDLVASGVGAGGYFVAIVWSARRLRPHIVLAVTGMAIVQYLALDLTLLRQALSSVGATRGPTWPAAVERAIWLLVAGCAAAGGAAAIQRRVIRHRDRIARRLEIELGRYLTPQVARSVVRGELALGCPQKRVVTVLFCDLRGFTFLCERARPEDVALILGTFYERAFEIVQRRGGIVHKILGDGLLALFNAPDELARHESAAAAAAVDLVHMVQRMRGRGGEWTHLAVGIGLDTGEVALGPLGTRDRAEYTAIGSPVNRAARLQSLAERESRRIIVSEAMYAALREERPVEPLGTVALKGFARPVRVYYLPTQRASTEDRSLDPHTESGPTDIHHPIGRAGGRHRRMPPDPTCIEEP